MAIQNRRGIYSSGFDTTKLVPGEFAVVQSGDPDGDNGYSLYLCFTSGNVQRIALSEEISSGGSNVTWTPSITTGEQIGVLTINGTAYNILAPKGGSSDNITNDSNVSGTTVSDALNTVSDQIVNIQGGSPTPAATVSAMVDTTKIYLYVGQESGYNAGHWYYYSGGAWVDGGAYGEAASMSAGVKAALLACFQKVAWIDENGQTYYDNLYNELYPPANLVSITANYTQSGTVYDTASLDDLKPDLVVTANYSDGTSQTVTTYTLSGTLEEGTSTVTVSYSGKTATFNVTVSHFSITAINLPYGAYIDTEYVPTSLQHKYLIGVQYLNPDYAYADTARPFAGMNRLPASTTAAEEYWHIYYRNGTGNKTPQNSQSINFEYGAFKNPNVYSIQMRTANGDTSESVDNLTKTPFYFFVTDGESKIRADENLTQALHTGTFASTDSANAFSAITAEAPIDSFWIGKVNQKGSRTIAEFEGGVKIFCFKVWDENDNLLVDMHPAVSGSAIGMYDSIRTKFFEAQGTGAYLS